MRNNCEDFLNMIKDDLVGELSSSDQAELQTHLKNCPNCHREKEEFDRTAGTLNMFEEQSVPGHFFVYEQPRSSLLQKVRNLPRGLQWASAAGLALSVFLIGFILANIQVQVGESKVILAYGDSNSDQTDQDLKDEVLQILRQAKEGDRRIFAGLLDEQRQQFNSSLRQYNQQIDARFNNLEGQLINTIDNKNTVLQNRLERTIYQYGELLKTQQQGNLREVNRRLTQITLEGRMRDSQTGALMATIAQLADSENRPTGGIDD